MNLASSRNQSGIFSRINTKLKPGMAFGMMILGALLFFEVFNYSTTDFALRDLLGDLKFLGMPWATILAIAFCGIDFAGIARIFTPEQGADEPKEVWYLFGAWLLAATMNAVLTWWGVSMAIVNHSVASTSVVSANTLTKIVPIFVALMVWVIRILIIGSLSAAGDRIFSDAHVSRPRNSYREQQPSPSLNIPQASNLGGARTQASHTVYSRPAVSDMMREPTYHSLNASPRTNQPANFNQRNTNSNSNMRRS